MLKIPAFESLYIRSLRQEIFGQLAPVSEAFTLLFLQICKALNFSVPIEKLEDDWGSKLDVKAAKKISEFILI